MDENKTKRSSETSPNISEISTIQTTLDLKINNIKEKNTKTLYINQSTQPINNIFSPNISKKNCCKKCKLLWIIICLISVLFILSFFVQIFGNRCYVPCREDKKVQIYEISNMTTNHQDIDSN